MLSCQILRRLRKAILTSGVVFIRDNARPHNAVVTQKFLEQIKCDIFDHPAYSPDLVTRDFHLFPQLKNWLRDQSFQKNEEIQNSARPISHHWRQRFSPRGSATLSTYMINTRIFTGMMSKSSHVYSNFWK
ncbi:hypothetical protein AVEN_26209-1 [Araneus ventricosus]|uniref:Histone-lysine N-methyltransferase SETMAR n=1 Tax=Araneus ventricosus TaxID=182803 RepID=A0A4Y2AP28_ARAVE|nr:hypothetical protein AVEN_26209-1 [Araneus ventricosus]